MTPTALHLDKMSEATIAIYDYLVDGTWKSNHSIIDATWALCAEIETDAARKNGLRVRRRSISKGKALTDAELVESGAKDLIRNRLMIAVRSSRLDRTKTHHRMPATMQRQWLHARPHLSAPIITVAPPVPEPPTTATTKTPKAATAKPHLSVVPDLPQAAAPRRTRKKRAVPTLVFGNINEVDGWAAAPLHDRSRVHFHTENLPIPLAQFRKDLPPGSDVSFNETTGLYRVDCEHGTGNAVRDHIRSWCEDRGIRPKSLRAEHHLRRRNLGDLNDDFLSDMCVYYAKFAQGRLRRHATTMQFHFDDKEDETQQVYEWVLEAASRYDNTSGVPFGAFLSERISPWVNDLNRSKYGRVLSDTELKHNRALQAFITLHGRKPTEVELAAALGQDINAFRKNAEIVSTIQGMRNIGTIDVSSGESEVALPDEARCEDRYEEEMQQSLLSQILTASCEVDTDSKGKLSQHPNVLGLAVWYETVWGGLNKTQIADRFSTSIRNLNEYGGRAQERMEARKGDLVGSNRSD